MMMVFSSLFALRSVLLLLLLLLPGIVVGLVSSFSFQDPLPIQRPTKVLVTGAAGKTGRLIMKRLEKDDRYEPKALVRTEKSARSLVKGDLHCPIEHMCVSDITSPTFEDEILPGLEGMDAMIICTSAVPRISRLSLMKAVLKIPIRICFKKSPIDFRTLQFRWKYGGYPEKTDYHGQVAQIELAKKLQLKHVIIISSMGGTQPDNFLNKVGKKQDGTGHGDILLWKRKSEMYLINSGLNYTIIHPGGLIDTSTPNSDIEEEEYVLDVDDKLGELNKMTRISRDDVAALCVASLSNPQAKNVSFDCITRKIQSSSSSEEEEEDGGDGSEVKKQKQKRKSAEEALMSFLQQSKTTNYSLCNSLAA